MRRLVVYYNTDENYKKTKNPNLWISIDGMHIIGPIEANRELIRGDVHAALLSKERYDAVGIFSPLGASYTIEGPNGKKHPFMYGELNIPKIDYETISPEDLRIRLLDRLASIRGYLKDPEIEIECIRGVPPT